MIDPRLSVIASRLAPVRRILAVTGGKGGIGKSVLSASLALSLRKSGFRVGLLDLDFTSPCQHILLGAGREYFPEEKKGIVPPSVHGIRLMTMHFYSGDGPAPLRGGAFTDAMIELLTITRWGELDHLIVDMPPGITDAALDTVRLIDRVEAVLVTVPSRLALETLRRSVRMLVELKVGVLGVVENMRRRPGPTVKNEASDLDVPFLGSVDYDPGLEAALGDPDSLLETKVLRAVGKIVKSTPSLRKP